MALCHQATANTENTAAAADSAAAAAANASVTVPKFFKHTYEDATTKHSSKTLKREGQTEDEPKQQPTKQKAHYGDKRNAILLVPLALPNLNARCMCRNGQQHDRIQMPTAETIACHAATVISVPTNSGAAKLVATETKENQIEFACTYTSGTALLPPLVKVLKLPLLLLLVLLLLVVVGVAIILATASRA